MPVGAHQAAKQHGNLQQALRGQLPSEDWNKTNPLDCECARQSIVYKQQVLEDKARYHGIL